MLHGQKFRDRPFAEYVAFSYVTAEYLNRCNGEHQIARLLIIFYC